MKKCVFSLLILLSILSFSYNIRIGDTLTIEVFSQPDFSRTVRVANDGTIPYPYAGNLKVVGLTPDQVKPLIEQTVGKFVKSPVVTVYVSQYAPMYIFIQGVLNRTFDISFLPEVTLSKLFSYLNITKSSEVDFTNVRITKKGKTDIYNMMGYFYDGTIAKDPVIEEGDIIYLPPLTYDKAVQISGAYTYSTPYEPGLTLRTLLLKLGPLNKDIAQIESSVLVVDNKAVTINLEDVIYGKIDYALKQGSTLYIPKRDERYVYVIGYVPSTGIKTFLPTEQLTLNLALAKAGGIAKEDYKWVESILITTPDGKVQNYDSTLLSKANEVKLTTGTVIEIRKYPEFKIYVTGDFAQQSTVNFDPDEPRTLSQLFVKIGGLKTDQMKWIESIKVNNQAVDMSKLSTYALKDKDVVEIKKYPEFKVYVTGDFAQQSTVTFDPDEPRTLSQLFVKIGGLKTDQMKWIESVKINNQTIDMSKLSAYTLKDKDVVEIKRYAEFKVYVTGDFAQQSTVTFDPDEPRTLSQLFVKIGGLKTDQMKWIESIKINNQTVDMSKLSTYMLKDKDIVEIKKYPEFYVYVQGLVNTKGKIVFEPGESKTLKLLVAKVGLPSEDIENEGYATINNSSTIDLKDVIYGSKDYELSLGDIVQITYDPFIVNTIGTSVGTVQLTYKEPRTLSYLIKKLGILQPESIEKVLLIRDGKQQEYTINQLLYDQISVPLAKYDTVILKQADANAVYITGDIAAYVTFAYNEPITVQRVLAKVGLSDLRKIEKITNEATTVDFTKDLAIQKGTILNVQLKKPIYVTAMGYIKNTGRVSFDYYETADLQTLFAKLGGLIISPDAYYTSDKVFIIEDGKVAEQYDAQKIFKGLENAPLRDGNFVYVTESTPKQVYVFGKGMQNGLVRFTQSEDFDLRTLIGKLGGIKEGTSKTITIIDTESTNTTIQWDEYANIPLKTNSMVLFDIDTRNFIYVVDPSGKPNMIYTDRSISLYEVLTKVGINKNYNKVELTSGTNKQTITLKSVSDATGYNVKPGDIVKISDASMNFIYVLGEVKNPGIIQVTEGMTVLQAVIQSGYFTAKAVPSTVWLYKGGVDGQAVKVNLSAAVGGGKIDFNPIVEPGDIVFVPTDMFKTAIEWVGTVASLVEMFNTIYGLFN
ncbi:MAG: polysaccharide biosynthesis/export family protein [Fervidobacterium sp.]